MASSTSVFLFENAECAAPASVFELECVPARPLSFLALAGASVAAAAAPVIPTLAALAGAALGVWGAALAMGGVGAAWRGERERGDLRHKLAAGTAGRGEGDRFAYLFPDAVRRAWRLHKGLPEYDGETEDRESSPPPSDSSFVCYYSQHGNLFMRYNGDDRRFHYWASKSIPRDVLEAAARKYVQTVNRPDLYRIPQYVVDHVAATIADPDPGLAWVPEPEPEEEAAAAEGPSKTGGGKAKPKRVSLAEARRGLGGGARGSRQGGTQKYAATYLDGAKETFDSNIFLSRGTLHEFEAMVLQTKTYAETNSKKGMSFSDFMRWGSSK